MNWRDFFAELRREWAVVLLYAAIVALAFWL